MIQFGNFLYTLVGPWKLISIKFGTHEKLGTLQRKAGHLWESNIQFRHASYSETSSDESYVRLCRNLAEKQIILEGGAYIDISPKDYLLDKQ